MRGTGTLARHGNLPAAPGIPGRNRGCPGKTLREPETGPLARRQSYIGPPTSDPIN